MFSAKFNFLYRNKLLKKSNLSTMDIVYSAQPFVYIVSKNQDTKTLDIAYNAQPFYGVN